MRVDGGNRIRLLRLWEILKTETDEEHPMSSSAIMERLKEYDLGCQRQTLYDDIKLLNQHGYEVLCNRSTSNEYYVIDRDFDVPEIQILMDAVHGAPFITKKKSKVLIDKLASLAGTQQGQVMKKGLIEYDSMKGNNEAIYYSINEIAIAIKNHKKIGFYYFKLDRDGKAVRRKRTTEPNEDRWYIVNPVKTIDQDGKYYLICYDDTHGKLSQYRIDRMEETKMLDEEITPSKEAETAELIKHRKSLVGMFGGRMEKVTFVADESVMDGVFDKLGREIKPYSLDGDKVEFTVEVQVGKPLLTWVIGFGKALKVTSPTSVVEEIKKLLTEAKENYIGE